MWSHLIARTGLHALKPAEDGNEEPLGPILLEDLNDLMNSPVAGQRMPPMSAWVDGVREVIEALENGSSLDNLGCTSAGIISFSTAWPNMRTIRPSRWFTARRASPESIIDCWTAFRATGLKSRACVDPGDGEAPGLVVAELGMGFWTGHVRTFQGET